MYTSSSSDSSVSEDDSLTNIDFYSSEFKLSELINYKTQKVMDEIDPDNHIFKAISRDCAYFTESTFNDSITMDKKISLIHFNCRSLYRNFESIKDYLNQFKSHFSMIAVSETWIQVDKGAEFNLPGYDMFYTNRESKKGGGVALYIDKNIDCRLVENMSIAVGEVFECVTIEIVQQSKNNIIVSCVYRAPGSDMNLFNEWMERLFANNAKKDIIICGDYNVDLFKAKKHKPTANFIDVMFSMNMYPLITKPTRITAHSATLIDNIFTNIIDESIISGLLFNDISDHLPVFMVHEANNLKNKNRNSFTYKRVITEQSKLAFKNDLAAQTWENVIIEQDVNRAYNSFVETFIRLYNKNCPIKKYKKNDCAKTPWMTKGLLNACKKKNNLYKQFLKYRTNEAELKYKKYKNKLTSILRENKKEYYTKLLNSKRNDIKGIWNVLNMVIGRASNSSCYPEYFVDSDKTIRDKEEIAKGFNNFFSNIGPELAKNIPIDDGAVDKLVDVNPKSFFVSPVCEEEVWGVIKTCNNKTSCDIDDINMKTIRVVAMEIVKPFTHICNLSFQCGQFPSRMKMAKIIPLYKSGDKQCFNNYRPVSLLPQFSKILEKLFDKRIRNFIDKHNLLTDSQYGFRQNRSTSLALIDLVEEISNCIDKKKFVVGIFIDLQKAFDTIDHNILINKLENYGIRGIAKQWLQSYLTGRMQCVQFEKSRSEFRPITCGVPQGSILGPTLFIMYINDIVKSSKIMKFVLFADDTNIIMSGENLEQLLKQITNEMNKLKRWFNVNKLSLNLKKTKFMLFGKKKTDCAVQIKVGDITIERVQQNVFLGVIIDDKLSWKPHINYLRTKIAKCVGVMQRASHALNQNALLILYNSFIMSYLNYCIEIWGNSFKSNLLPLMTLQKKAIRIVHKVKFREHTNPLFLESSNLKLCDLVTYKTAQIMFKASKKSLPTNIQNMFHERNMHHSYNLRGSNKLYQPKTRTTLKYKCISVQGVILWNGLAEELKASTNLVQFKRLFIKNVMSKYMEETD